MDQGLNKTRRKQPRNRDQPLRKVKRPSPNLPTEIRVQIVSYIADELTEHSKSRCTLGSLFALSLVSKCWHATANYFLYNHLRLDVTSSESAWLPRRRQWSESEEIHHPNTSAIDREPRRSSQEESRNGLTYPDGVMSRLAASLKDHPNVADTVREITLGDDYQFGLNGWIIDILRACENLEHVRRKTPSEPFILVQLVTRNKLNSNDWDDVVDMLKKQRLKPSSKKETEIEKAREKEAKLLNLPKGDLRAAIATRSRLKSIELSYSLAESTHVSVLKAEEYYPLERWYNIPNMEEASFRVNVNGSRTSYGSWNENLNAVLEQCSREICKHISTFLRAARSLKDLSLEGADPGLLQDILSVNKNNLLNLRRLHLKYERSVPVETRDKMWELLKELMREGKMPRIREVWCLVGLKLWMTASDCITELFTVPNDDCINLNKLEVFTMRIKGTEDEEVEVH